MSFLRVSSRAISVLPSTASAIAFGGALEPAERRVEIRVRLDVVPVHGGLSREHAAEFLLQLGPRIQEGHELALAALPLGDDVRALERRENIFLVFQGVGEAEDLALE